MKEDIIEKDENILFLFDVDGTLTESRQKAPKEIIEMLKKLKEKVFTAFVGGSDLPKQKEQLGENIHDLFDYEFPENGVQFFRNGELVSSNSMIEEIGESNNTKLINSIFKALSEVKSTVLRGTFIESRRSMLNVSPIGRSCSQKEREDFFEFDKKEKSREKLVSKIKGVCDDIGVQCSIGGQISIDIFPKGWDKRYCLQHIKQETIIFFGDKVEKGGNDYEIFNHERVKGIFTTGSFNTIELVKEELKKLNK
ncbi:PMM [Hepatospora eriocheir]|uniref:Phosphomannomutase n=1 Tax=Hepatospora eriocheir TaxID=1081669 RepID=A0A1X0QGQ9_9MICR|nr:PMM [Hepatospora eriocheir]